ncbi:MAG: outer membrane protein assembly factor BamD [Acidobacteria bacterium]|nr:MAG: outer membrane protein assembly factor BamD [Acidobacteriota bacterium]
MRFLSLILAFLLLFPAVCAQPQQQQQEPRKGRKPVLIREDPNETKIDEQEVVIQPNSRLSAENLHVGDFYFRRDNYKAAAERYREAIKYNRRSVEAYEKLARSLEKQKLLADAIGVCEEFIAANPSSKEISRFRDRAEDMRSKLEK